MIICSVVSLSAMVLTYKMSQTTSNITKTCNKCTNFIKTIKATTQFVVFLFVHSWEQRKLGDIVDVRSGKDYKHLSEGNIPVYGTGGYMLSVNQALSYDEDAIGIGRKGTIDKPYILKAPFWTVDTLFYAVPRQNSDLDFVFDIFQNIDWKKKDESTGVPSLSKTAINEIDISAPCLEEQQVIGSYFSKIDNLITLHQREFFRLILAFFCCNSTSILPISWEQRKLGDVATEMVAGGDIDKDLILNEGRYPVIANALTNDGVVGYYNEDYRIKAPAVTVTGRGDVGHAKARIVDFTPVVRLLSVKSNHDIFFLENAINTLKIVIESTGVPQLTVPQLAKYEISFPKSLDEEEKIGTYFRNLDNLITLHQCECLGNSHALSILPCPLSSRKMTSFWEQRKLGDTVQITMGQSPDGSTYSDVPSDYILVQGNADLQNGWVSPRIWTSQMTKKADAGDLIMSVRAPAGAMGKTAYNAVIGRGVAAIKGNEFIYQLLVKMDSDGYWKALSCGSTFESLNSDNIKNADVLIPNAAEQKKIGQYFANLDNLITLHQRECLPKTCSLASWFYQQTNRKMTSFWEQRKLNEVVNVYDGVHQTPDYKDSGVMFLSVENISTLKSEKYISEEAFQRDYKVYPQKGDILMTRIGDVGTPNVVETTEKVAFYVSLALLKPTKINSYFLCNSIQSPLFQKGLKDRTLVTAIPQKINKDEIGKVNIILPTSSQEQQLIGDYFRNLDNLITLHQCKDFSLKSVFEESKNFISALRKNTSWEQRKVSEMFKVTRGYVLASTLTEAVKTDKKPYPVYSSQTKDNGLMGYYKDYLYEDAITWTTDGANAGTVNYRAGKFYCTNVCGVLLSNEVTANQMIAEALNNVAKGYVSYVGNPKLMNNVMADIEIMIPTQSEEREKLSVLFRNLDNLITLHQRIKIFFTGDYHDQKNK